MLGIREVLFDIKGREFLVVDVGGQRSERRKWVHFFDNVNAIIYLAALDEYDKRLEEDALTNCLEESLQLFHDVRPAHFRLVYCEFVSLIFLLAHGIGILL